MRVASPPPKSPSTRLHPLTDLLRQENTPGSRPTSPLGRPSTRSQRTTITEDLPPITMQLSQTPSGDIGLTQIPGAAYKGKDVRAPSRQSRTERTEDEDGGSEILGAPVRRNGITEIDLTRTPRSTYTALTTPSALAGEVNASHFHDEELCILLHAADNENTHEVVKKVLHKGVRDRVRKLGLDHQREVCC